MNNVTESGRGERHFLEIDPHLCRKTHYTVFLSNMQGDTVQTNFGKIRGRRENGVWAFKGIPYAAPLTNESRFIPPRMPYSWSGVFDAFEFGPIAPQPDPVPAMSILGDPTEWDENCLTLNIWTPAADGAKRPVMVWIHGGGFSTGSSAQLLYRGDRLARNGDVVVVTINYRLGSFGFLAHPRFKSTWATGDGFGVDGVSGSRGTGGADGVVDKDKEYCGNWGIMDQIAALQFIQETISVFGGDPSNVTIFGESAGGMSVVALLAAKEASGLFHKAIIESGPPSSISMELATKRALRIAELVGVDTADMSPSSWVRVSPEEIIKADQQLSLEVLDDSAMPLAFMPTVDGGLYNASLAELASSGQTANVPLLIGTNRDETAFFSAGEILSGGLEEERLLRRIARILSDSSAAKIIDEYRHAREGRGEGTSPVELWTAISTDYVFRLPSIETATAHVRAGSPAYVYLFDWETPFMGSSLGSCHALEVPFVFGTIDEPAVQPFSGSGQEALELSNAMQQAWVSFARSSNPSCDLLGEWPVYGAERPTMILGRNRRVVEDPRGEERKAWDGVGVLGHTGHHA